MNNFLQGVVLSAILGLIASLLATPSDPLFWALLVTWFLGTKLAESWGYVRGVVSGIITYSMMTPEEREKMDQFIKEQNEKLN